MRVGSAHPHPALKLLQTLIDALPHPVVIKDDQGHYLCSNSACDALVGPGKRELYHGKTLFDLPHFSAEQKQLFDAENKAALQDSAVRVHRIQMSMPDGHVKHMLYSLGRIQLPHDGSYGMLVSLVDISEAALAAQHAEQAQALLRQLTDNLPVSVFQYVVSAEGVPRATYATKRAYDLFGLDPQQCMANIAYVFETLLPEYRGPMLERMHMKWQEQSSRPFEFQMYDQRDGRIRWVLSESVSEPLPDGSVICNGYWVDVTERKALEAELLRAKEAAETASKAKAMFLANMSHEIRTPMNAILGMTYLALQGALPDKQRSYLENIQTAAKSLLGIIDDILDSSKIEAGKLILEENHLNIHEVVKQVLAITGVQAAEKGLVLRKQVDAGIPERLRGDSLRLGQVLTNLVGNAVKFTEHGHVEVDVQLLESAPAHCVLKFSVRDTGVGMTSEQCARLFQAFTQVDGSTTRRFGGTGLGLSISKELVELMGGEIHVASRYRQGSTFSFTLYLPRDLAPDLDGTVAAASATAAPPRFSGQHVLVAEDNEFNQVIAVELLESVNLNPIVVDNGQAVLDLLQAADAPPVSLVLMDLQLPQVDGYETTQRLRQLPQFAQLPVIAMTAHAMREERSRCIQFGMNDHISKPIDPATLYRTLSLWLPADPH